MTGTALSSGLTISRTDPRTPEVRALVAELDAFLDELYPDGADYLTSVEDLATAGAVMLLAGEGTRAVGCAALLPFADYGEIKRMYVRPAARGHRIGRALLDALEAEARALRLGWMRLETGEPQVAAVRLYEQAGFVRCGAFGDYPADTYSLFMEKPLTA